MRKLQISRNKIFSRKEAARKPCNQTQGLSSYSKSYALAINVTPVCVCVCVCV